MAKTKEKKEKKEQVEKVEEDDTYDAKVKNVCPIAHPLASKKINKKVLKTVKKAAKGKQIRRGVKEVVKSLRKQESGLVVIAGDISPIDVISHLPVLCEDNGIPYIFTPSKEELGLAGGTKRPTSVILIKSSTGETDWKEGYDEIVASIKQQ